MSDLDGCVTVSLTSRKVVFFFLDILDVAIAVRGLVHRLLYKNE